MGRVRKSLAAAAVTGLMACGLGLATAGPAQAAWQCSVPPGMTYNWVTWDAGCGVTNGMSYNVVAPAEGMWACMVPVGWNWTASRSSSLCSANGGFPTTEYRLTRAG